MSAAERIDLESPPSPEIPAANSTGLLPDQFLALCADDDGIYELIRGEVVQLTPAGEDHSEIESETFFLLRSFVKEKGLGTVWAGDAGFILEKEPYTVRSPDVAFISKARLSTPRNRKSFFPGAPDLAVEILSPTDSLKAAESKAMMYLRAGGSVVWILDPKDRSCRIYRRDEAVRVLGPEDDLDAEPVLPGFRCPVARLYGG